MKSVFRAGGYFSFWIFDRKGRLRHFERFHNGIPAATFNDVWSVYFKAGTQKPNWFGGLISDTSFDELSDDDTIGSHAGWQEFTAYDELTRQALTFGTPGSAKISSSARMRFTVSSPGTIRGGLIASNSTKGGSTGQLFATGLARVKQIVQGGEAVQMAYELTGANG